MTPTDHCTALTANRVRRLLRYNELTGALIWQEHSSVKARNRLGSEAGRIAASGYRRIMVDGRAYFAHRLVWLHVTGQWPAARLDHIDQNKLNNRIDNLRECIDGIVNEHNIRLPSSANRSGVRGVYWNKEFAKWHARIRVCGFNMHLGFFADLNQAAAVRQQAERRYHKASPLVTASVEVAR